eukprot:PhF_6_TR15984/c0_g1_i1/m.25056/K19525/VPS13A_C; vacuolar protein sorting-associated protein 13A/C
MLEGYIASIFASYLGRYVKDLDMNSVKVSVWNGSVQLDQLLLKRSALSYHGIPVFVHFGSIQSLTILVPWSQLSSKSCEVVISDISMVLVPKKAVEWDEEEEAKIAAEIKRDALRVFESSRISAAAGSTTDDAGAQQGYFSKLQHTILHNLVIKIQKIHIRYEDTVSNPANPFVFTFQLDDITFRTTDGNFQEAFLADVAQQVYHKILVMKGLSIRVTPGSGASLLTTGRCAAYSPEEWAIKLEILSSHGDLTKDYVLHPLDVVAKARLSKLGDGTSLVESRVHLPNFSFTIQQSQYVAVVHTLRNILFSHTNDVLRKFMPSREQRMLFPARCRWQYAIGCTLHQIEHRRQTKHFDWDAYCVWKEKKRAYCTLWRKKMCPEYFGDWVVATDEVVLTEMEGEMVLEIITVLRTIVQDELDSTQIIRSFVQKRIAAASSGWFNSSTKDAEKKETELIMRKFLEGEIPLAKAKEGWSALGLDMKGLPTGPLPLASLVSSAGQIITFQHSVSFEVNHLLVLFASDGIVTVPLQREPSVVDEFQECLEDPENMAKITAMIVLSDAVVNYVATPMGSIVQLSTTSFEIKNTKCSVLQASVPPSQHGSSICISHETKKHGNKGASWSVIRVDIPLVHTVFHAPFFQELVNYLTFTSSTSGPSAQHLSPESTASASASNPGYTIETNMAVLKRHLRFYCATTEMVLTEVHVANIICTVPCGSDAMEVNLVNFVLRKPAVDVTALKEKIERDECTTMDFYSTLMMESDTVTISSPARVVFENSGFGLEIQTLIVPYTPHFCSLKLLITSNKGITLNATLKEVLAIRQVVETILDVLTIVGVYSSKTPESVEIANTPPPVGQPKVQFMQLGVDVPKICIIPIAEDGKSKSDALTTGPSTCTVITSSHDMEFVLDLHHITTQTQCLMSPTGFVKIRTFSTYTEAKYTVDLASLDLTMSPGLVHLAEYMYDALIIALYEKPAPLVPVDTAAPSASSAPNTPIAPVSEGPPPTFKSEFILTAHDITITLLKPLWQRIQVKERPLTVTTTVKQQTLTTRIHSSSVKVWQYSPDRVALEPLPIATPDDVNDFTLVFEYLRNMPPCRTVRFTHQIRLNIRNFLIHYHQNQILLLIYVFGDKEFSRLFSLTWRPYYGTTSTLAIADPNPMDVTSLIINLTDCIYVPYPTCWRVSLKELHITNTLDVFLSKVDTTYAFRQMNIEGISTEPFDMTLGMSYSYDMDVGTHITLRIPTLRVCFPTHHHIRDMIALILQNVAAPYPTEYLSEPTVTPVGGPPRWVFSVAITDGSIQLIDRTTSITTFELSLIWGRKGDWALFCHADMVKSEILCVLTHLRLRWVSSPQESTLITNLGRADLCIQGVPFLLELANSETIRSVFTETSAPVTTPSDSTAVPPSGDVLKVYTFSIGTARVYAAWPLEHPTIIAPELIQLASSIRGNGVFATLRIPAIRLLAEKDEFSVFSIENVELSSSTEGHLDSPQIISGKVKAVVQLDYRTVKTVFYLLDIVETFQLNSSKPHTHSHQKKRLASGKDIPYDIDIGLDLDFQVPATNRNLSAGITIVSDEEIILLHTSLYPLILMCSIVIPLHHIEILTCSCAFQLLESDVAEIVKITDVISDHLAKRNAKNKAAQKVAATSIEGTSAVLQRSTSSNALWSMPWTCRAVLPDLTAIINHGSSTLVVGLASTKIVVSQTGIDTCIDGKSIVKVSRGKQLLCQATMADLTYVMSGNKKHDATLKARLLDVAVQPRSLDVLADIAYSTLNPLRADLNLPTEVLELQSDMTLHGDLILGPHRILWIRQSSSNLISVNCHKHKMIFATVNSFPSFLVDPSMNARIISCVFETQGQYDIEQCMYLGDSSYVEYSDCVFPTNNNGASPAPTSDEKTKEEGSSGRVSPTSTATIGTTPTTTTAPSSTGSYDVNVPSVTISIFDNDEGTTSTALLCTGLSLSSGQAKDHPDETHGQAKMYHVKIYDVMTNGDVQFQWWQRGNDRKKTCCQIGEGWYATLHAPLIQKLNVFAQEIIATQLWSPSTRFLRQRAPKVATALQTMQVRAGDAPVSSASSSPDTSPRTSSKTSAPALMHSEFICSAREFVMKVVLDQNAYRVALEDIVVSHIGLPTSDVQLQVSGSCAIQHYDSVITLGWEDVLQKTSVEVKQVFQKVPSPAVSLGIVFGSVDVGISRHALFALMDTYHYVTTSMSAIQSNLITNTSAGMAHVEGQFPYILHNLTGQELTVLSSVLGSVPEVIPHGSRKPMYWTEEKRVVSVIDHKSESHSSPISVIDISKAKIQSLWLGDYVAVAELTSEDSYNVLTIRSQLRIRNLTGHVLKFPGTGMVIPSVTTEVFHVPMAVTIATSNVIIAPAGYSSSATLDATWKSISTALNARFNHVVVPARGGLPFNCIIDVTGSVSSDTLMVIYPTYEIENATDAVLRIRVAEHRPSNWEELVSPIGTETRCTLSAPSNEEFEVVNEDVDTSRSDSGWTVVEAPKLSLLDQMASKIQSVKGEAKVLGEGKTFVLEDIELEPGQSMRITSYDVRFPLMIQMTYRCKHGLEVTTRRPVQLFQGLRGRTAELISLWDTQGQRVGLDITSDFHRATVYAKMHILNETEFSIFVAFGGGTSLACGQAPDVGVAPFTTLGYLCDQSEGKVRVKIGSDGSWCDAVPIAFGTVCYVECEVSGTDLSRTVALSFELPTAGKFAGTLRIVPRWILVNRTALRLHLLHDCAPTGRRKELMKKTLGMLKSLSKLRSDDKGVKGDGPKVKDVQLELAAGSSHPFCMGTAKGNTFSFKVSGPGGMWSAPVPLDGPISKNINLWVVPAGSDMDSPEASFNAVRLRASMANHMLHIAIDEMIAPYSFENRTDSIVYVRQRGSLRPITVPARQTRSFYLDDPDEEPVFTIRIASNTYEINVLASTGQPKVLCELPTVNGGPTYPITALVTHRLSKAHVILFHAPSSIFRDVVSRWNDKNTLSVSVGRVSIRLPQGIHIAASRIALSLHVESMIEYTTFKLHSLDVMASGEDLLARSRDVSPSFSPSGGSPMMEVSYTRHLATFPLVYLLEGTLNIQPLRLLLRESVLHEIYAEIELLKLKRQATKKQQLQQQPSMGDMSVVSTAGAGRGVSYDTASVRAATEPTTLQLTTVKATSLRILPLKVILTVQRAKSKDKRMFKTAVGFLHVLVRNMENVGLEWAGYDVCDKVGTGHELIQGAAEFYKKQTLEQVHKVIVASVVN